MVQFCLRASETSRRPCTSVPKWCVNKFLGFFYGMKVNSLSVASSHKANEIAKYLRFKHDMILVAYFHLIHFVVFDKMLINWMPHAANATKNMCSELRPGTCLIVIVH